MNDQSTSGNRWEPDAAQPGGSTATAVQEPPPHQAPPSDTWAPPAVPQRRGLKDRWRDAPRGARRGATGVLAVLLLLGFGLGGFALGRASAPDGGGVPDGTRPDGPFGGRDLDGDGNLGGPGGFPGQGTAPDGLDNGADSGLDSGLDSGTGTGTLSWYVVPRATTGPSAA